MERLCLVFFNLAKVIFLYNNLVEITKTTKIKNHNMLKKDKLTSKKPSKKTIPRLFVFNFNYQEQQKQQKVLLDFGDFNYLINVLRLNIGNQVIILSFSRHGFARFYVFAGYLPIEPKAKFAHYIVVYIRRRLGFSLF